ncbi:MAG: hypothetical protein AB1813_07270 [Verrucomicrobiota bacterium]
MPETCRSPKARSKHLLAVLLFSATLASGNPAAEQTAELRIRLQLDDQGRVAIHHTSATDFYYVLYRGEEVTKINLAVDLRFGGSEMGELRDSAPAGSARFYRVQRVPVAQPMDTDNDGIDDVWELRFRRVGAALDVRDALDDHTGNAVPDLHDYRNEAMLPIVSFAEANSVALAALPAINVRVNFSKEYQGVLRFEVGGTALPSTDSDLRDYEIPGFDASTRLGQVEVNGREAVIPILLKDSPTLDRDRTLVLSLVEGSPLTYRLAAGGPLTHRLLITEAREALGERSFLAMLTPTNNSAVGPQSFRLAIRATARGGSEAFIDAAQSTLFPRQFPMAATIENGRPRFVAPAIGSIQLPGLNRTVTWTFSIENLASAGSNVWSGGYRLEFRGLTAAQQPNVTAGSIQLTAAN